MGGRCPIRREATRGRRSRSPQVGRAHARSTVGKAAARLQKPHMSRRFSHIYSFNAYAPTSPRSLEKKVKKKKERGEISTITNLTHVTPERFAVGFFLSSDLFCFCKEELLPVGYIWPMDSVEGAERSLSCLILYIECSTGAAAVFIYFYYYWCARSIFSLASTNTFPCWVLL